MRPARGVQRARRALGGALALAWLGAGACGAPLVQPAPDAEMLALEHAVHEQVNRHRSAAGLAPLAYDEGVASVAREHSRRMARGAVPLGHDGFEAREQRISERLPLRAIAENVASLHRGPPDVAAEAVRLWLGSAGHRANLEGCFDVTGVGAARDARGAYYLTQIFVRTAAAAGACP